MVNFPILASSGHGRNQDFAKRGLKMENFCDVIIDILEVLLRHN